METTEERVSHYRILRRLGRGGMGEVFEAEDETLRRHVALKAIRAANRPSPREKARFLREARILSQLDHPGICRIYDYLDGKDRDHLVLELIQGQTLAEADVDHPLDLIEQLLQVLVVAHDADIIHRDLKPANVMVTPEGVVKVLDFGLARQATQAVPEAVTVAFTNTGADTGPLPTMGLSFTGGNAILGTPAFMSPEQSTGEGVTAASDMYSCGLVMHFLLSGESAYGDSRQLPELLKRVRKAETIRLTGVDSDLADLVSSLTRRAPGSRPTATEALRRLRWIRHKPDRRNRRLLTALVVLLVLGGGLKYTLDVRHERQAAQLHRSQAEDLLSFMLGDLQAKLAPISRLDIMDAVGSKALAYFSGRDPTDLSGDDADRYVRTLNLIGQIRLGQGKLVAAQAAFAEALHTAQPLVARDPTNADWQIQLGATRFYLGSVAYSTGDLPRAEIQFRHYHRISQALVDRDDQNPVWRQELAYAQTTLAQLFKDQNKLDQAMLMLDEALTTKSWLVAQDPTALTPIQDLANSQAIYGSILQSAGRLSGALARFSEARQDLELVAHSDSLNFEFKSRLAVLLQREGRIHELMGHDAAALALYERDLVIGRMLVQHDPTNVRWQRELVTSLVNTGYLLIELGQLERVEQMLADAENLTAHLPQRDPVPMQHNLRTARAKVALARSEYASVLRELQPSGDVPPLDAQEHLLRGQALTALQRTAAAAETWQTGLSLITAQDKSSLSSQSRDIWARLSLLTGHRDQATALATELSQAGYARHDFPQFRRSLELFAN